MLKHLLAKIIVTGAMASTFVAVAQSAPAGMPPTNAANILTAPAPKKPGITRIGVAQPKMDMGSAANSPEVLRTLLAQYLAGPTVEVMPLTAMIPMQVEAEAKQKECDYILYASLSVAQKKGGMGFLRSAQSMAGMVPVIGMAGRTGAIVGEAAARTAITAAGQLSSGVKAKSEVTFDYQLMAPGAAAPVVANNEKAKAQSDGQDIISPMVEHAATAITGVIVKK